MNYSKVFILFFSMMLAKNVFIVNAEDDFDFDAFFDSLFEGEDKEDEDLASDREEVEKEEKTEPSKKKEESPVIDQEVSIRKKDNFLKPLSFGGESKEEGKERKIKVPQAKKDAFLYYSQKLVDFLALIRDGLDVELKDASKDFMSLSDAITAELLSIDKQYLLRTMYHKDFTDLRKEIYNTLTKKISRTSLRSLLRSIEELHDDEDDEDRLTFERHTELTKESRQELIEDMQEVVENDLKPILEGLQKISKHAYAVEQQKKKSDERKRGTKKSTPSGNKASWVVLGRSYGRGGNNNWGRGRSNDYGRGGYGGGYYPRSSDRSSSQSTPAPSTSPSTSGYTPLKEEQKDKAKEQTRAERIESYIQQLFQGFGKPITDAIKALNKLPNDAEKKNHDAASKYIFARPLQALLNEPYLEQYYKTMREIDLMYQTVEASQNKNEAQSKTKSENKKEPGLNEGQKKKYQEYQAFKKNMLIPFVRAQKSFIGTKSGYHVARQIVPAVSVDLVKQKNLIDTLCTELAASYPAENKKINKELPPLFTLYTKYVIKQTDALASYLQEYATILSEYEFKPDALLLTPLPKLDDRKDTEGINLRLKELLKKDKYASIKHLAYLKSLPHAENVKTLIGEGDFQKLDDEQKKKFFHYIKQMFILQKYTIAEVLFHYVTLLHPTIDLVKRENIALMRDIISAYSVNEDLNKKIVAFIQTVKADAEKAVHADQDKALIKWCERKKERFEQDKDIWNKHIFAVWGIKDKTAAPTTGGSGATMSSSLFDDDDDDEDPFNLGDD